MRTLQFYLIPFLCFSLSFGPYSYAQSQVEPSEFPSVIAMQRFLIMRDYKNAKNITNFVRIFAGNRPREEQKYIEKKIAALGSLPRIERSENGVTLSQDGYYLRIDFSHASEKVFIVNGHRVQVDPNQPLPPQAEDLIRRLEDARRGKFSLFSLFAPEAHSAEGRSKLATFFIGAGGYMAVLLGNKFADFLGDDFWRGVAWEVCSSFESDDPLRPFINPYVCRGYLAMKDEILKKNPANTAVRNALLAGQTKSVIFSTAQETCPFETDNKSYSSTVMVSRKNSEHPEKTTDEWVKISADFTGEKLTGLKILEDDNIKATEDTKVVATYKLDGDSVLTEIEIPNPDLTKEAPSPPPKKKASKASSRQRILSGKADKEEEEPLRDKIVAPTVRLSATADLKNDPKMQALQTFYRDIFVFFAGRLTVCKAKKQDLDAAKALEAAKGKGGKKETAPASKSKGAK